MTCHSIVLYKASIFTHGCFYRNMGVKMMSMFGSVTDAQVFSRELTDLEMIEMTGCRFDRYRNEESSFVCLLNQNLPHWRYPQLGGRDLEPD